MAEYIEIAGIILILVGIVYTFLRAMGRFSAKAGEEGEIESKMFTLKGGPGIILVGLGVFLLIIAAVSEKPVQPSPVAATRPEVGPTVIDTPTKEQPAEILPQEIQPTIQPEVPRELPAISLEYVIGTWRYTTSDGGVTFRFLPNGIYESEVVSLYSEPIYSTGRFTVSDSTFSYVNDVTGITGYFSLTYIDKNTMIMDNNIFERIN